MVQSITRGVIALLLFVTSYFLKLLIQDIKQMSKELGKWKEVMVRLQSEQAMFKTLLGKHDTGPKNQKF
ncbi:MAG TPA: hypothetical protein VLA71_06545 [Algoriphagus sp.]|nr:hypothetical protein [Algoriphagus sp.]